MRGLLEREVSTDTVEQPSDRVLMKVKVSDSSSTASSKRNAFVAELECCVGVWKSGDTLGNMSMLLRAMEGVRLADVFCEKDELEDP
jgi:hypothetical protein